MYYQLSTLQKIAHNAYDAGGQIVFIRQKFLTSQFAVFLGIIMLVFAGVYGSGFLVQGTDADAAVIFAVAAVEGLLGIFLIVKGQQGKRVRSENGGVHPTDTLHILNGSAQDYRRRIGDVEERLASFDEIQLNIKTERSGKSTRHFLQVSWPGGKENLIHSPSKKKMEELLVDIRTRLGLPPEDTAIHAVR